MAHDAAYDANPYPCVLRVDYNGGINGASEVVTVPAAQPLTNIVVQQLLHDIDLLVSTCNAKIAPNWPYGGSFNPVWNVDPPPEDKSIDRRWQFEVTSLDPGDPIQLMSGGAMVLCTATANSRGVARLSALIPNGAAAPQISLVGTPRQRVESASTLIPDCPASRTRALISSAQVEVVPQSTLALPDHGLQIEPGFANGRPAIMVLLANRSLDTLDVTNPANPRVASQTSAPCATAGILAI